MQAPEILSALTTPFTQEGEVDLAGLKANLERVEPFSDGIFAAGTTAEFLSLSVSEHQEILETALRIFGPDRVVIHVGAPSTRQAVELARHSRAAGARRFAAITPIYLPATGNGITRHWAAVKEACQGELYGYIYPDVAVTDLLPAQLPEVLGSGISGIKVSALASTRVAAYLVNAPDGFKLWSGNDADLPQIIAHGGCGTVSGVSGVCPWLWAELREGHRAGDTARMDAAQRRIERIVPLLGPSIAALKLGLDHLGAAGGACRMVIDQPDDELASAIARTLDDVAEQRG